MKRITVSLSSLLIISTLLITTSCQKEETANGTQFRASMEDCTLQNGKTSLSGTALNWVSGDRIAVYGTVGRGIYSATPQENATTAVFDNISGETGNPIFRAFYPTTLTTDGHTITLPTTQTYVENSINEFPMYAESNSNTLNFKNLCGALKLHLTKEDINISSIVITVPDDEINGTFSVSFDANGPQLTPISGSNTITLTCATAQSIATGKDFFIYLPAGDYSGLRLEINTDDGRNCIKTANTAISVTRSQYTLITLGESNLRFPPIGSKGGLFTINDNGDQVWFSQGNLLWHPTNDVWSFSVQQYLYEQNGWQDKFRWGTGMNPASNTGNSYDYLTFVDWGANAISNGGNCANSWRTLTGAEWNYIYHSRINATSKYGTGNVDGHSGMILLPDNFNLPSGCSFNPGMATSPNDWTRNSYTNTQWQEMESAGAVFIPNNQCFHGTGYPVYGGCYWASNTYDEIRAYTPWFDGNWLYTSEYSEFRWSFGVRLVQDAD